MPTARKLTLIKQIGLPWKVADLVRQGRDVERRVLAQAVRWHLERRVLVYHHKTVVFT